MPLPKVYISVLNWNGYEQTIRCLHSLESLDYPNYQVIVVDNASGDDSVDRIRAEFPDVQLIRADTNRGYAGGNELALKEALADPQAELFWILNNDTIVRPDTLTTLVEAYQQYGEALYGGVPLTEDSQNGQWRIQMNIWEYQSDHYQMRKLQNMPFESYFPARQIQTVGSLAGSTLLIPLSVVRKYGFIDTSFFLYSEDIDYSFRLRRDGLRSFIVPSSVIFHVNGGSRQDKPELKPIILYYQARARLVLARRHLGIFEFVKIFAANLLYAISWLLMSVAKGHIALQCGYYMLLGLRDGLFNRMGKTFAPEQVILQRGS